MWFRLSLTVVGGNGEEDGVVDVIEGEELADGREREG